MREKDIDLANTRTFVTLSFSITSTWWHTVTKVHWRSQKKPLKTHRFLQNLDAKSRRLTLEMTNIHLFAKLKPQYRTSLSSSPFRHYPKTSFTIVTDTPENLRLKQQSMLNSQVRLRQIPPVSVFCCHSCTLSVLRRLVLIWLRHDDSLYLSLSYLSPPLSRPVCLPHSRRRGRVSRDCWIPPIESNKPLWANADTRAR